MPNSTLPLCRPEESQPPRYHATYCPLSSSNRDLGVILAVTRPARVGQPARSYQTINLQMDRGWPPIFGLKNDFIEGQTTAEGNPVEGLCQINTHDVDIGRGMAALVKMPAIGLTSNPGIVLRISVTIMYMNGLVKM